MEEHPNLLVARLDHAVWRTSSYAVNGCRCSVPNHYSSGAVPDWRDCWDLLHGTRVYQRFTRRVRQLQ
jgi:hypothetical protein